MNKKHLQNHLDKVTQIWIDIWVLQNTIEETKLALLEALNHSEEFYSDTERKARQLEIKLKQLAENVKTNLDYLLKH